jgi:hypothetical protein
MYYLVPQKHPDRQYYARRSRRTAFQILCSKRTAFQILDHVREFLHLGEAILVTLYSVEHNTHLHTSRIRHDIRIGEHVVDVLVGDEIATWRLTSPEIVQFAASAPSIFETQDFV